MRHDNTVTWLAYWKDPVNDSQYKYVWLAANSTFKSDSDLAKYEKARKLKDYIGPIRCVGSSALDWSAIFACVCSPLIAILKFLRISSEMGSDPAHVKTFEWRLHTKGITSVEGVVCLMGLKVAAVILAF